MAGARAHALRKRRLASVAVAALLGALVAAPAQADGFSATATSTSSVVRGTATTLAGMSVSTGQSTTVTLSTTRGTLAVPSAARTGLSLSTGYVWSGADEISFSGSESAVNTALAAVELTIAGGTAIGSTADVTLAARPSGDAATYNPDNGHYYQYVPGSVDATSARSAALSSTYYGLSGYLVTITSAGENSLVTSKIPGALNVWIGATGTVTAPRVWTWVDGPEAGQSFTRCNTWAGDCDFVSPTDLAYRNWSSGEPNNANTYGEDWAVTNWNWASGLWNDLYHTTTSGIGGYVVEYGGGGGTSTLPVVSATVTVVDVPTAPGDVVAVADAGDQAGSTSLSVTASAPSGNGLALLGYEYSVDGGSSWHDSSDATPDDGASFSITGLAPGSTYTVLVRALNDAGAGATGSASAVTLPAPPTDVTFTRDLVQVGTEVSATFASDGYPAPTFAVTAGALPAGLTLNTQTGALSGTPTAGGAASFTVTATNSVHHASRSVQLTVWTPPTSPAGTVPQLVVGDPVEVTISSTGNPTPSLAVVSGALPDGLSFDPETGELSGTPAQAGEEYTFTVRATGTAESQDFATADTTWSGTVHAYVTTVSYTMPILVVGTAIGTVTPTADGFPAPTFQVTDGQLPAGLSLDEATGALTGTPTTAGLYEVTVTASNSTGTSQDVTLSGRVGIAPSGLSGLPTSVDADSYLTLGLHLDAGDPDSTFAVTSGHLPDGLELSAAGVLSGTPSLAGSFSYTITASNGFGSTSRSYGTVVLPVAAHAPTDLAVQGGDHQLMLSFQAPSATGGLAIVRYEVSVDGGTTWSTLTTTSALGSLHGTVAGLTPGASYPVRVRAVTSAGAGAATQSVVGSPTAPAPDKPDAPRVAAHVSSVAVSWDASTALGVTGYRVTEHPSGLTCVTTSTSCLMGAVAGLSQTFTVTVLSVWGDSEASAHSAAVVPRAPEPEASAPQGDAQLEIQLPGGADAGRMTAPGQALVVVGHGFAPGSTVLVVIYSTPQVLASGVAAADGTVAIPVTVPLGLQMGHHTLVAYGVDAQGELHTLALPIRNLPSALAATGTWAGSTATWALVLAAVGLLVMRVRRRLVRS